MRALCLLLGTILGIFLIIFSIRGARYSAYVENLDSGEWPMSDFYVIGWAMQEVKFLALKGKAKEKLVGSARILHDPNYAEYYACLVWAQALTFGTLFPTFFFLLAAILNFPFFGLVGLGGAGLSVFYFLTHPENRLKERREACAAELPEVASSVALLLNSGMVLGEAWRTVARSNRGVIYDLMRNACDEMENGMSEKDAIHHFGVLTDSREAKKFAGSLIQGIDSGSGDLGYKLASQSGELWNLKKQVMLQRGKAAESKLLIPTVMIFAGIIVMVLCIALSMLL